jgi:hypothetical protein
VPTLFTKNRERLLEAEVAHRFLAELLNHKQVRGLLSDEHFSVDCRATIKVRGHIASSSNAPHRWTVASSVMFPLPHAVDAKMIDRRGPFFCSTRAASILPSRPA